MPTTRAAPPRPLDRRGRQVPWAIVQAGLDSRGASAHPTPLPAIATLWVAACRQPVDGTLGRKVTAVGDELEAIATRDRASEPSPALDRLFGVAVTACLVVTLLIVVPGVHGHLIVPALDLMLDTIAMIVCIALTALAWARFRERHVVAAAYHAAAFMALSAAYGIAVLVSLQHATDLEGLAAPDDVQVLVFVVARLAAAILFVLAGVFTRRPTYGWGPIWILVAPTLTVLLAAVIGRVFDPPPDVLQIVTYPDATGLPHTAPFGGVVHLVTAVLFFSGAYVSRGLWHTRGAVIDGWIAIGLVFAGFAELQATLYPSAHPGQVSTADLLRLACSACLLAGLAGWFRASQRELASGEHRAGRAARCRGRAGSDRGALAAGARAARRAGPGPVARQAPDWRAGEQGRPVGRCPAVGRERPRGHRHRARRSAGGRRHAARLCATATRASATSIRADGRGLRRPVRASRGVHL